MNAAKFRIVVVVLVACTLGALGGCASRVVTLYDAVERSTEQISVLRLPFEIEVVAIDGKKFKGTLPVASYIDYEILPGEHAVALRYFQAWKDDDHNNEFVKSPVVVVSLAFEPGATYLAKAEKPKTIAQARHYASRLAVTVVNEASGKSVSSVMLPPDRQDGGLLQNIFKKNTESSEAGGPCVQNGAPCTPFDQLNFWWGRATDDEKSRFRLQTGIE